jgi:type II secretory pathway pseudopilin PulG
MTTHVNEKGYSLLELVVVLAVFFLIMAFSLDVFISLISSQRRILDEQELLNQTSFAMDYISSGLETAKADPNGSCLGATGYIYVLTHCPNGNLSACNGIKFINHGNNDICDEFYLDILSNPTNPPLKESQNGGAAQNLISTKFLMMQGNFVINGDKTVHTAMNTDTSEPRVTMLLNVKSTNTPISPKILQTTVSQRNLNYVSNGGGVGGLGGVDGVVGGRCRLGC